MFLNIESDFYPCFVSRHNLTQTTDSLIKEVRKTEEKMKKTAALNFTVEISHRSK